MIKDMLFLTVGGLGMFLFGMSLMSDGLKKVAGQKMKNILESLTKKPVIAVLVGAMVTCLIQSSSATTVMTVGFVNAGLLTLKQALCVVLGANIGTTLTAWLVSVVGTGFKITAYALPAIGIGFLLHITGKREKIRSIGLIFLGFGLLFVGIGFMKDAFDPLKDSAGVQQILIYMGENPIYAVLAGTIITMLLQSSSASIAMVQLLAFQGAFGVDWDIALKVAIPYILGDNIGTTITAQIASLQVSRNSKRTAMGHTIFNVIGVLYMLPLVWTGIYSNFIEYVTPWQLTQSTIALHLAIAHTVFNVANTIIFLPITGLLEYIVLKIIPVKRSEAEEKPIILERHLLDTPSIALLQARKALLYMAKRARKAFKNAVEGMNENSLKKLKRAHKAEDSVDEIQREITSYLVELSRNQLSDEISTELPILLHAVNDVERIGDHATNIADIGKLKFEEKLDFSSQAQQELNDMVQEVFEMFRAAVRALSELDQQEAEKILQREPALNRMQIQLRKNHITRLSEGKCSPDAGILFVDLVDNLEKIGDHLTNIGQAILRHWQWGESDETEKPRPTEIAKKAEQAG